MRLTFDNLTLDDQAPIYVQIVRRFKLMMAQGALQDGDEAPSRRALAVRLGVNPNTVQRAFAELEQMGFIETPANAKSIVRLSAGEKELICRELIAEQVRELVSLSRQLKMPFKQLMDLVSSAWEELDV